MITPDTVHTHIEDTIFDSGIPVNTLAMLNRLKQLIIEHKTNSLLNCNQDPRIKRLMWLINSQMYGQLAEIDLMKIWKDLYAESVEE